MNLFFLSLGVFPVLYLGPGYLASRFIRSAYRDQPLFWIFSGLIITPLAIAMASVFYEVQAVHVWFFCLACLCVGIVLRRMKMRCVSIFPSKKSITKREQYVVMALLFLFLYFLIAPKLSLLLGDFPSVGDDQGRIRFIASIAFNLSHPKFFAFPLIPFQYYVHDFLLPATAFRLLPTSVQTCWFLHNVVQYVTFLWFFWVCACELYSRSVGRIGFLLSVTFLSGLDYFVYRFSGVNPGGHLEWWYRVLPIIQGHGFQVSSFYTLFLWVPHHLEAGLLSLLIALLYRAPQERGVRVTLAILLAALFRTSPFVFLPVAFAVAYIELLRLFESRGKNVQIQRLLFQAVLFAILSLPFLLSIGGRSGVLSHATLQLRLFNFFPQGVHSAWNPVVLLETLLNTVLTFPAILFVDMGVVFVLGAWFLLSPSTTKTTLPRSLMWAWILAPILLNSFYASSYANELFMRGMIPAELMLAVAFAFFLDRHPPRRYQWVGVVLLVAIHGTNMLYEFTARTNYPPAQGGGMFRYIREQTSKDAVFFSDNAQLCDRVALQGNRVCMNNAAELAPEVVAPNSVPVELRGVNFHALTNARAYAVDHPRYILTSQAFQQPWAHMVMIDEGFTLYEVRP